MGEIRSIGVLGYENCSEQDTITSLEIMKGASMLLQDKGKDLVVQLVNLTEGNVSMQFGTQVVPDAILDENVLYDLLYVPGGVGSGALTINETVLKAVRAHYAAGKVVVSNCSGLGILFRAGILGDNPVTCVAAIAPRLRDLGVNVPHPRRMWIGLPDQRLWTVVGASGVHASTVALMGHYFGRDIAESLGMMFDTLGATGEFVHETRGPEMYFHPELEQKFVGIWEDKLLPVIPATEEVQ